MAEKELWYSVIAQAINDAHGAYDPRFTIEKQFTTFRSKVNKMAFDKVAKCYKPLRMIIAPETIDKNILDARNYFMADYGDFYRDLNKVCEYAEICPHRLRLEMRKIISDIRNREKTLNDYYNELRLKIN